MTKMTTMRIVALACLCGLGALIPKVSASEFDKKTIFTFSAPVDQQNVPSMPGEPAQNTTSATEDQNSQEVKEMKETKLQAQKPSGEEVEMVDVFLIVAPAVPVAAPAPVAVLASPSSADRDAPAQLPQTASSLPRLALIGVFLLAVGLGLQARVRRAR